jgi:predicted DNA-binding transcriptional regulator YafY
MQQVTVRHSCTSKDIEQHWRVTRRTAKRDIAGLVAAGAIRFIRLGKGGYYMAEL